jgi:hypothetical protein
MSTSSELRTTAIKKYSYLKKNICENILGSFRKVKLKNIININYSQK